MKKYNIKGQKDTQKNKKKKRKMADVDCKGEKVPAFLSVRKNIEEMVEFDSILLCLNFSIISSVQIRIFGF